MFFKKKKNDNSDNIASKNVDIAYALSLDDIYQVYQNYSPTELGRLLKSYNMDSLASSYNIMLVSNEHLYYLNSFVYSYSIKNQVIGHSYNSDGVGFSVMKGVSLRSSSGYSKVIRGDVATRSKGKLYITNHKVILAAIHNGFELKISDISNMDIFTDAIVFYKKGMPYIVSFEADGIDEPKRIRNIIYLIIHAVREEDIEVDSLSAEGQDVISSIAQEYAAKHGNDSLYESAIKTVLTAEQCSASLLQRRLELGYETAYKLVHQMEADGIVGPAEGSKPRKILIHLPKYGELK